MQNGAQAQRVGQDSFCIPALCILHKNSLLVRGIDDLHEVSGLQGGAADQAAVLVVAKSASGGTP